MNNRIYTKTFSAPKRSMTLYHSGDASPRGTLEFTHIEDVHNAVMKARTSFDNFWCESELSQRVEYIKALLELLIIRQNDFAHIISLETGSPIDFSKKQQVQTAINHVQASLKVTENLSLDLPVKDENPQHRTRYEAMGVAALITPWNWPLNQVILKVVGAFLAGCTILLKPSELTTETALLLEETILESGVPDGVFNLIIGDGIIGQALISHPQVDVISFTGSTETGQKISVQAASQFKPCILELGGKSANIIFADCIIEKAVQQGVAHCFRNSGQSCNAASRMLVERSIYDEVLALVQKEVQNIKIGMPEKKGNHLGPLISKRQYERVQKFILSGIEDGAHLLAGGPGKPTSFEKGYFVKPTVFADVTEDMAIFKEEIFGPVLTITPFDEEAEAIRLANATPFGLSGYIQSSNHERLNRLAARLKVGMVQVNGQSRIEGAAFGGVKASGMGREAGLWGIRAFQHIKSISGVTL